MSYNLLDSNSALYDDEFDDSESDDDPGQFWRPTATPLTPASTSKRRWPSPYNMDPELLHALQDDGVRIHSKESDNALVYLGYPIALSTHQQH